MIANILAVAIGGAIGSVARYVCVMLFGSLLGSAFPWGTLAVNCIGGLAIGALAAAFLAYPEVPAELRLLLITGLLGGFTTFSAFSLEVVDLAQRGAWAAAGSYILASVGVSVLATVGGMRLVRAVWL